MSKRTKKKIVTIAMVVCVFALAAAGTLAYFADKTEVVENTFTIGKVQIRLSEGIVDTDGHTTDSNVAWTQDQTTKIWTRGTYAAHPASDAESKIYDAAGTLKNTKRTEDGNTTAIKVSDTETYGYALVPGRTVDKDPVVTVLKNSEPSYVRVEVTLDHAAEFIEVYRKHNPETTIEAAIEAMTDYFVGYDEDTWVYQTGTKNDDNTVTVIFNYKAIVPKNTEGNTNLEPVINGVTLPEWVDNDDVKVFMTKTTANDGTVTYSGTPNFGVTVIADAIQAEGFANAEAAWTAFDTQMNPPASGDDTGATGETTNP